MQNSTSLPREYKTPQAFKTAVEHRLRAAIERSGIGVARARQLMIFHRFLARMFAQFGNQIVVKGGVVVELRVERARTTRDVDLRFTGSQDGLAEALRSACRLDLGDFLSFEIAPAADRPRIQGDGVIYEGFRFRAEAKLAGRIYGMPFGVDVAFADVLTVKPEIIDGSNFLEFLGVPTPKFRVYPRETHIAEKLHAYTLPRTSENSRVKDLPDIALLATTGTLDSAVLRKAIYETFAFRKSHSVPVSIADPPMSWAAVYQRIARDDQLPWDRLGLVVDRVRQFLLPVLDGRDGSWSPASWRWEMG